MMRYKYSLSNCKKIENMNSLDLLNIEDLDENITGLYSSADGENEDEEYTEYENEETQVGGEPMSETELPKFRILVRNKKLELKSQYGKARMTMVRESKNIPYPCPTFREPLRKCSKSITVSVPKFVFGWRKQWRDFVKNGGLAQLRMQSKGLAPIPAPVSVQVPITSKATPKFILNKDRLGRVISAIQVKGEGKSESDSTTTDTETADTKSVSKKSVDSGAVDSSSDDKILGMPKNVAYGLGILVLAIGGYVVYKKMYKK